MSRQVLVDIFGCDSALLDDSEYVSSIARGIVRAIGSNVVGELSHAFEPIGVTYVAILSTSHLAIHTWPESGRATVDIFSCAGDVPSNLADMVSQKFGAKGFRVQDVTRDTGGGSHAVQCGQ